MPAALTDSKPPKRYTGSRTLRDGDGTPIATAEANGTGQLSDQKITFGLRLGSPLVVPQGECLLAVGVDVRQTPAVRLLGLRIEHHASIKARADAQTVLRTGIDIHSAACLSRDHGEHVKVTPGRGQKACKIRQALQVPQAYR